MFNARTNGCAIIEKRPRKASFCLDVMWSFFIPSRFCRYIKKVVASITLIAFIFTSIGIDYGWAARTSAGLSSVGSAGSGGPAVVKDLNVSNFSLPEYLGTVKDSWSPSVPYNLHPSPYTIIHIQDAHCNYGAQHTINDIIAYLSKEYGVSMINLEGGAKDYDLSIFTTIQDSKVREQVTDSFVKEGLVNGAEYFAINNPDKASLWGIEDSKLYIENLKVYRDGLTHKEEIDKGLKSLNFILSNLKAKIYSKELLAFDMQYSAYKAGNLEFKDYLNSLIDVARQKAIDIKSFANISLLSRSLEEEKAIDFKKANNERDKLIDQLSKRLSDRVMQELVMKTVEFKAGRLSQSDFYAYLIAKARYINLDVSELTELQKYISYFSRYDAVDKSKIMEEIAALEEKIKDTLYRNDTEKKLALLSKNLAILKNIFNITLTKDDFRYYRDNADSFNMSNYISFVNSQAPLYKIDARLDNDISRLDQYREDITKFYDYSLKRDEAFLRNVKFSQGLGSRVKGQGNQVAVIVTGGFHTENLCELFKKNNISYISIMPNFKNPDGYECPYFSLLAGEMTALQKKLYSVLASLPAPAATMQVATLLSSLELANAVWGPRGVTAFKVMTVIREKMPDTWKNIKGVEPTTDGRSLKLTMADGPDQTMALSDIFDAINQRQIDVEMERGQFREITGAERLAIHDAALQLTDINDDVVRPQIESLFRDEKLHVQRSTGLERLDQDGHVGGFGVSIRRSLTGSAARHAALHEIVAGFVEDHTKVDSIVEALINDPSKAKRLFAKEAKHTTARGVTALWEMTPEERLAVADTRDLAAAGDVLVAAPPAIPAKVVPAPSIPAVTAASTAAPAPAPTPAALEIAREKRMEMAADEAIALLKNHSIKYYEEFMTYYKKNRLHATETLPLEVEQTITRIIMDSVTNRGSADSIKVDDLLDKIAGRWSVAYLVSQTDVQIQGYDMQKAQALFDRVFGELVPADRRAIEDGHMENGRPVQSTLWNRYSLERGFLGSGAFGTVRPYIDTSMDKNNEVAVKLFDQRASPAPGQELAVLHEQLIWLHEASILERLKCLGMTKGIVGMRDFGVTQANDHGGSRKFYLVMDRMGPTLRNILDSNGGYKLNGEEATQLTISLLNIVTDLHNRGIWHCDIKPENIFVSARKENGKYICDFRNVSLGDFGSAVDSKSVEEGIASFDALANSQANTTVIPVTFQFAPPEILKYLENRPSTNRVDLYQIGATLFKAVTGEYPYGNLSQFDVVTRAAFGTLSEASLVEGPDISPQLTRLIYLLLKNKPEDRPASPQAALAILNAGSPQVAEGPAASQPPSKGVLLPVMWFVSSTISSTSKILSFILGKFGVQVQVVRAEDRPGLKNFLEDFVVPVIEEGLMLWGLSHWGAPTYIGIRIAFIALHLGPERAPPPGLPAKRTPYEKTLIPAIVSAVAIGSVIPALFIGLNPLIITLVGIIALATHIRANRYVTTTGSRLGKAVLGQKGIMDLLLGKGQPLLKFPSIDKGIVSKEEYSLPKIKQEETPSIKQGDIISPLLEKTIRIVQPDWSKKIITIPESEENIDTRPGKGLPDIIKERLPWRYRVVIRVANILNYIGFKKISDLLMEKVFPPAAPTPAPVSKAPTPPELVRMATYAGRLPHSSAAIEGLAKEVTGRKPVVYDIGIGWAGRNGPVTVKELAEVLDRKADVIGIDSQIPAYVIYYKPRGGMSISLIFDRDDRLLAIQSEELIFETEETVGKDERAEYIELAKKVRKAAGADGRYVDSEGEYQIDRNPIATHSRKNMRFVSGDLFNLNAADMRTVPKADVVRIANLIIPHFELKYIERALQSLSPMVNESGYVLIGYSPQLVGNLNEEHLVYRKRGDKFVLESYMFSVDADSRYIYGVSGFLPPPVASPVRAMMEQLHDIFQNRDPVLFNDWAKEFKVMHTEANPGRTPEENTAMSEEIAKVILEGLRGEGVEARRFGAMIEVKLEAPVDGQQGFKADLMGEVKKSFVDEGAPTVVHTQLSLVPPASPAAPHIVRLPYNAGVIHERLPFILAAGIVSIVAGIVFWPVIGPAVMTALPYIIGAITLPLIGIFTYRIFKRSAVPSSAVTEQPAQAIRIEGGRREAVLKFVQYVFDAGILSGPDPFEVFGILEFISGDYQCYSTPDHIYRRGNNADNLLRDLFGMKDKEGVVIRGHRVMIGGIGDRRVVRVTLPIKEEKIRHYYIDLDKLGQEAGITIPPGADEATIFDILDKVGIERLKNARLALRDKGRLDRLKAWRQWLNDLDALKVKGLDDAAGTKIMALRVVVRDLDSLAEELAVSSAWTRFKDVVSRILEIVLFPIGVVVWVVGFVKDRLPRKAELDMSLGYIAGISSYSVRENSSLIETISQEVSKRRTQQDPAKMRQSIRDVAQSSVRMPADPKVYYIGIGHDYIANSLIDTDYRTLIGVDKITLGFTDFKVYCEEQVAWHNQKASDPKEAQRRGPITIKGFEKLDDYHYRFDFTHDGKERSLEVYYGTNALRFVPPEILKGYDILYLRGINFIADETTGPILLDRLSGGGQIISSFGLNSLTDPFQRIFLTSAQPGEFARVKGTRTYVKVPASPMAVPVTQTPPAMLTPALATGLIGTPPASLLGTSRGKALGIAPWLEEFGRTLAFMKGGIWFSIFNLVFIFLHYPLNRAAYIDKYKRDNQGRAPPELSVFGHTIFAPLILTTLTIGTTLFITDPTIFMAVNTFIHLMVNIIALSEGIMPASLNIGIKEQIPEAFGNWLRNLSDSDIKRKRQLLEALDNIRSGLDADENTRRHSVGKLKTLIEAGLFTKEEVAVKGILDMILSGLADADQYMRCDFTETLKALIKAGLVTKKDLPAKGIPLDKILSGLADTEAYTRWVSAETLKVLIEAGVEVAAKGIPLDKILSGLAAGEEINTHRNSADTLKALIEAKLVKEEEVPVKDILEKIADADEYTCSAFTKLLKALIEAKLVKREDLSAKNIPLDKILSGLDDDVQLSTRFFCAEALKALIEARLVTKEEVPIKGILDKIVSGLANTDHFTRRNSAETLKVLIEAGVEVAIKGIPLDKILSGLVDADPFMRQVSAEALKFLIEAKLVTKEDIPIKDIPLDKILSGLVDADPFTRRASAGTLKLLIKAGLVTKEEAPIKGILLDRILSSLAYAGLNALYTGQVDAETVKSLIEAGLVKKEEAAGVDLSRVGVEAKFSYYYIRLIELLKGDEEKAYSIFRYLDDGLLKISTCFIGDPTEDIFYRRLAQLIKDGKPAEEARVILEGELQGYLAADISTGHTKQDRREQILGRLLSVSKKLSDRLRTAFKLLNIEFEDGGNSPTSTSSIAEAFLKESPVFRPLDRKGLPAKIISEKEIESYPTIAAMIGANAVFVKALGRTLIFYDKDKKVYLGVKILKEWEKESTLQHEYDMFAYIQENYSQLGLRGQYPSGFKPLSYLESIPDDLFKALMDSAKRAEEEGKGFNISKDGRRKCPYTAIVYEVKSEDYFTYLHDSSVSDDKFKKAFLVNLHDLGALARHGIVHRQLADLFHNLIQSGRPDGGVYSWMADITRNMRTRFGTGRLHAWEGAVSYPNMRMSGAADFSDLLSVEELGALMQDLKNNKDLGRFSEVGRFGEKTVNLYIAHYLGDYLLTSALILGKRMKDSGKLNKDNWRDGATILENMMKEGYAELYHGFTGKGPEKIEPLVDWGMLGRQMAFFMSGEYRDYDEKYMPEDLFGIENLGINEGDGWGFIHEKVISSKLKLGISGENLAKVLDRYFVRPTSGHRQIPYGICKFKEDFNELIKAEADINLKDNLISLHKEYSKGWRFNGITEDLGPVNGPIPLQELIKANYIYTMFMLEDFNMTSTQPAAELPAAAARPAPAPTTLPTPSPAPEQIQRDAYVGTEGPFQATYPVKLIERLRAQPAQSGRTPVVVELGCGEGQIAEWINDQGFSVLGIDKQRAQAVDKAIAKAREQSRNLITSEQAADILNGLASSKGVAYQQGDIAQGIPLPDSSVDAIVLHRTYTQIDDQGAREKIVKEIFRVLKPGGLISYLDFKRVEKADDPANIDEYERMYKMQRQVIEQLIRERILPERLRYFMQNPDTQLHMIYSSKTGKTKTEEEYRLTNGDLLGDITEGRVEIRFINVFEKDESVRKRFADQGFAIVDMQEAHIPGKLRPDRQRLLCGFIAQKPEVTPLQASTPPAVAAVPKPDASPAAATSASLRKETLQISKLNEETEMSLSGPTLNEEFVGGTSKLQHIVTDTLPEFSDVRGLTTTIRGMTLYKRMSGSCSVWAINRVDKTKFAQAFGLTSREEIPKLNEETEMSLSGKPLEDEFVGGASKLKRIVTDTLPEFSYVRGLTTTVRDVTLYKRRSGGHRAWAINRVDKAKFAQVFGLTIREEIPKLNEETEMSLSGVGLNEEFIGGESKLKRIVTNILPEFGDVTGLTTTVRGITLYKRISGNSDRAWAIKRADKTRFAQAFGLTSREEIPKLNEETEMSLSGKPLEEEFVGGASNLKRIVTDTLPKFSDVGGLTTTVRGITLYKRISGNSDRAWAINRVDKTRFAQAFGLTSREEIPKLNEETEMSLSSRVLEEEFVGAYDTLKRIVTNILPEFSDVTGLTTTVRGITLYKRIRGGRYVWAINRVDKAKFAQAYNLKIRNSPDDIVEQLGLSDAIALLGNDPLRLKQYLIIYHPDLLQDDIDRVIVHSLNGLGARWNDEIKLHEDYKEELMAPPAPNVPAATDAHCFVLSGKLQGNNVPFLQLTGAYTRKIAVRQDGSFSATIPLPVTGEVNEFRLYCFDPETKQKSPAIDFSIHQTSKKEDMEEAFLRLLALKQETLDAIKRNPLRYNFLLHSVEQRLLRYFTYSEESGFKRLKEMINNERSETQRSILQAILAKFEDIKRTEFNLNPGQRLYFFQKYCIYEVRAMMKAGAKGVIIANEQGLGKTVTALAIVNGGSAMVVTPNAVVTTWTEEEERFFPRPTLESLEGSYSERQAALPTIQRLQLVTNVEFMRGMTADRNAALAPFCKDILVVDEADYLGSMSSQQSRGTRELSSKFKILLSATPFKRPSQIGHVLGFLRHGDDRFSSARAFSRAFPVDSAEAMNALFLLLNENTLRIRKQDVFEEYDPAIPLEEQSDRLPKKAEIDPNNEGRFDLTDEQCQSILELFTDYQKWCRKHKGGESEEDTQYYRYKEGYFSKKEALRQIMNNPAYIGKDNIKSPKHIKMDEIVEKELSKDPKRKVLIFCRYKAQVEEYQRRYSKYGARAYYGGLRANNNGYKTDEAGQVLYYEADEYENCILDKPSDKEHGRPIRALDYERRLFQEDPNSRVLVATYDQGALGVTLTAADVVIYDDLAPTYRDQYQAGDRAHRIDSNKKKYNVTYYWLQARYPESFLKSLPPRLREEYFQMGTYDQVHLANIKRQGRIFHRIMDGIGSDSELRDVAARFIRGQMPFLFDRGDEGVQEEFGNESGDEEDQAAGGAASSNPEPVNKPGDDGNVTCGTICEAGHQELLDTKLEQFYKTLAKEGGITRDLKQEPLTGTEVIDLLKKTGKIDHDTAGQLQVIISHIKEKIPDIERRSIQLLFAMPDFNDSNKKLWWIKDPETGEDLYAGGHFNQAGTRIHISLPLILSILKEKGMDEAKRAARAIAAHDYKHIKEGVHDDNDEGMQVVRDALPPASPVAPATPAPTPSPAPSATPPAASPAVPAPTTLATPSPTPVVTPPAAPQEPGRKSSAGAARASATGAGAELVSVPVISASLISRAGLILDEKDTHRLELIMKHVVFPEHEIVKFLDAVANIKAGKKTNLSQREMTRLAAFLLMLTPTVVLNDPGEYHGTLSRAISQVEVRVAGNRDIMDRVLSFIGADMHSDTLVLERTYIGYNYTRATPSGPPVEELSIGSETRVVVDVGSGGGLNAMKLSKLYPNALTIANEANPWNVKVIIDRMNTDGSPFTNLRIVLGDFMVEDVCPLRSADRILFQWVFFDYSNEEFMIHIARALRLLSDNGLIVIYANIAEDSAPVVRLVAENLKIPVDVSFYRKPDKTATMIIRRLPAAKPQSDESRKSSAGALNSHTATPSAAPQASHATPPAAPQAPSATAPTVPQPAPAATTTPAPTEVPAPLPPASPTAPRLRPYTGTGNTRIHEIIYDAKVMIDAGDIAVAKAPLKELLNVLIAARNKKSVQPLCDANLLGDYEDFNVEGEDLANAIHDVKVLLDKVAQAEGQVTAAPATEITAPAMVSQAAPTAVEDKNMRDRINAMVRRSIDRHTASLPRLSFEKAIQHLLRANSKDEILTFVLTSPPTMDDIKRLSLMPFEVGLMRLRGTDMWVIQSSRNEDEVNLKIGGSYAIVDIVMHNHSRYSRPIASTSDMFNQAKAVGVSAWVIGLDGMLFYDTDRLRHREDEEENLEHNYMIFESMMPRGGFKTDPKTGLYTEETKNQVAAIYKKLNISFEFIPWDRLNENDLSRNSGHLADALRSPIRRIRHQALTQLLDLGSAGEVIPLLKVFAQDESFTIQDMALDYIEKNLSTQGSIDALKTFLDSTDLRARLVALKVLSRNDVLDDYVKGKTDALIGQYGLWEILSPFSSQEIIALTNYIAEKYGERIKAEITEDSIAAIKPGATTCAILLKLGMTGLLQRRLEKLQADSAKGKEFNELFEAIALASAEGRDLISSYLKAHPNVDSNIIFDTVRIIYYCNEALSRQMLAMIPFAYYHETFCNPEGDVDGLQFFIEKLIISRFINDADPNISKAANLMMDVWNRRWDEFNFPLMREEYLRLLAAAGITADSLKSPAPTAPAATTAPASAMQAVPAAPTSAGSATNEQIGLFLVGLAEGAVSGKETVLPAGLSSEDSELLKRIVTAIRGFAAEQNSKIKAIKKEGRELAAALLEQDFIKLKGTEILKNLGQCDASTNNETGVVTVWVESSFMKKLAELRHGEGVCAQAIAFKPPWGQEGIPFIMLNMELRNNSVYTRENLPHETAHIFYWFWYGNNIIASNISDSFLRKAFMSYKDEIIAKIFGGGHMPVGATLKILGMQEDNERSRIVGEEIRRLNDIIYDISERSLAYHFWTEKLWAILKAPGFRELEKVLEDARKEALSRPKEAEELPRASPMPVPAAPTPATVMPTEQKTAEDLYGAAQRIVPDIISMINKGAPTFDLAPTMMDDKSFVDGCDAQVRQVLGKSGHVVNAKHYTVSKGADGKLLWDEKNFTNRLNGMVDDFCIATSENPTGRMIVRILDNNKRGEIKKMIDDKIRAIVNGKFAQKSENERDAIYSRISGRVNIVTVNVEDCKYLNPVTDVFADIGMMEVNRYAMGDYDKNAPEFNELTVRVANLLRLSASALDVSAGNLIEILREIFNGTRILEIRKIDWESNKAWKAAQDAVLKSL